MRYKIDHDYHIHSYLSACSRDPEQNAERILRYAKDNGLSRICITDHYWDTSVEGAWSWYAPQNFDHISEIKPLPQCDGIEFLFGCEGEMDKFQIISVPSSRYDDFEFMIIPTTHMHMKKHTITLEDAESEDTIKIRARLWTERFDALLDSDIPFSKTGVAHLACGLVNNKSREDYLATLENIPDSDMERVFAKAAKVAIGIELNQSDMNFSDTEADTVLRMFRIAKHQGCKFYLGSDAHHPSGLAKAKEIFERAITFLDLSESDKFHIE